MNVLRRVVEETERGEPLRCAEHERPERRPTRTVTTVLPETTEEEDLQGYGSGHWVVVVYDNDYNTFDEVIAILLIATRCSLREAQTETWEVHHLGKSVVHFGSEEECRRVADIISTIGIRVEVREE